jgi:hypothetical protein
VTSDQADHSHPSPKPKMLPHKTDHSRSAHNSRHLNMHPARWRPPRRRSNTSGQTREQARPETHQNLIHPDKDLPSDNDPRAGASNRRRQRHRSSILNFQAQNHQCRLRSLLRDISQPTRHPNPTSDHGGGDRTRTDDPLLAKQVLSQLSYTPSVIGDQCPAIRRNYRSLITAN